MAGGAATLSGSRPARVLRSVLGAPRPTHADALLPPAGNGSGEEAGVIDYSNVAASKIARVAAKADQRAAELLSADDSEYACKRELVQASCCMPRIPDCSPPCGSGVTLLALHQRYAARAEARAAPAPSTAWRVRSICIRSAPLDRSAEPVRRSLPALRCQPLPYRRPFARPAQPVARAHGKLQRYWVRSGHVLEPATPSRPRCSV